MTRSRHPAVIVLAIALTTAGAQAAPPPAKPVGAERLTATVQPKVAMVKINGGDGYSTKSLELIEEILLEQFQGIGRFQLIGYSDIARLVGFDAQKQLLGCESDSSCIAEIAGALGVDLLLAPSLGRLGSSTLVSMKLIEVRGARVLVRASREVEGDDGLRLGVADLAADVARGCPTDWAEKLQLRGFRPIEREPRPPSTRPAPATAEPAPTIQLPALPPPPPPGPDRGKVVFWGAIGVAGAVGIGLLTYLLVSSYTPELGDATFVVRW